MCANSKITGVVATHCSSRRRVCMFLCRICPNWRLVQSTSVELCIRSAHSHKPIGQRNRSLSNLPLIIMHSRRCRRWCSHTQFPMYNYAHPHIEWEYIKTTHTYISATVPWRQSVTDLLHGKWHIGEPWKFPLSTSSIDFERGCVFVLCAIEIKTNVSFN